MNKLRLTIVDRIKAPTPRYFKKLRNIGLIIGAISATVLAAPVTLPTVVTTIAGYLFVASGVLSAVSQATVEQE